MAHVQRVLETLKLSIITSAIILILNLEEMEIHFNLLGSLWARYLTSPPPFNLADAQQQSAVAAP